MNIDMNFLKRAKERGVCPLIVDHSHYENIVSRNYLEDKHYEQKIFDGAKVLIFASLKDVIEFKMMLEDVYTDFNFILDSVEERSCHVTECKATIVLKRKTLEEITDSPEYKLATKGSEEIEKIQKEISDFSKMLSDKNIWMINLEPKIKMLQRRIEELQTESIEKEKIKKQLTEINEEMDALRAKIVEKEKVVEDYMDIKKYLPKEQKILYSFLVIYTVICYNKSVKEEEENKIFYKKERGKEI